MSIFVDATLVYSGFSRLLSDYFSRRSNAVSASVSEFWEHLTSISVMAMMMVLNHGLTEAADKALALPSAAACRIGHHLLVPDVNGSQHC